MLGVFLGGLLASIALTIPIAFALLLTAILMMIASGQPIVPQIIAQNVVKGLDNFPMLAIPFFMFAGEIMNKGGITNRIVRFTQSLMGHIRGGTGYVSVMTAMLFAGVSGAAVADTTAVGSVLLPIMERDGYEKTDSTALICSAGCIGPIIPPSIPMILYGVTAGVSIVKLFLGGIVPGLMVGLGLMVLWFFKVRKKNYRKFKKASLKEVWKAFRSAIWAILLPVIIMGSIIFGIATPTEAAVVAVIYALFVSGVIYKELKVSYLPGILIDGIKTTAGIMFVVGTATATAYMLTITQIPELLSNTLLSISNNPYVIILMVNFLLLIVGCVMDATPTVLILTPVLLPIIESIGLSPIHFGVLLTINICIGLLTPPVGVVLYTGCSLSKITMDSLVKSIWPYIIVMIVVLLLVSYFPGIIMLLPNLLSR